MSRGAATVQFIDDVDDPGEELLDRVFFALSDPVRRAILERLGGEGAPGSARAAAVGLPRQALSRRIQVLGRAGLGGQERTGRISRCSLVAGPVFAAAVWINRYSKYWQEQFDLLAVTLENIDKRRARKRPAAGRSRRRGNAT